MGLLQHLLGGASDADAEREAARRARDEAANRASMRAAYDREADGIRSELNLAHAEADRLRNLIASRDLDDYDQATAAADLIHAEQRVERLQGTLPLIAAERRRYE
jgi:hypothetical protein